MDKDLQRAIFDFPYCQTNDFSVNRTWHIINYSLNIQTYDIFQTHKLHEHVLVNV